ncbi:MFS transporter [Nocardia amamiensis]|uniref:MFS transporter n=1 Tax=Nocardia amamiensis TaxID=404578 RepID=UPI00082A5BBE|nr:MFS transporter [Nocardia amamiensis]
MVRVGYAFAVVMLGTTMPTPMYTSYAAELGFSISMSTAIFAMYAAGVVAALILFGRWSDVLGRRPLLIAGLAFSAASSLVFLTAGSVWQLLLGRALSGLSAGIFTGTATAMIVEAAPARWKTRAHVVAGVANIGGLGIGPTLSGALIQYGPWPLRCVFAVHLAMVGLAVLAIRQTNETVAAQPRSRPTVQRLSIPPEARQVFIRAATAAFAGFCVIGLFASVVPTFLNQSLHVHNQAIAGLLVSSTFAASAAAQVLTRALPVPNAMILGCTALILSAALVGAALSARSVPILIAAAVIAGVGQGTSFSKGLGAVVEAAPPSQRGEIASTYFVVAYFAISVPALGVGLAAQHWNLSHIGIVFGAILGAVATVSLLGTVRAATSDPGPASAPALTCSGAAAQ